MDIANLRAFAEVAAKGSFSAAAERLHISQPAVSKRIAVLEDELGAALFDRLGRRTELTEAGRALLQQVPDVEYSLRKAAQAVDDLKGEVSGTLRIATSHHIGLHRLPPVLSIFQQRYPAVRLDIEFLDSELAYERLRSGLIELAVVTLAPGDVSKLRSEALWVDRLEIMIAPDHELAGRRDLGADDLAAWPAVLPGLDTFTGQIVRKHFSDAGLELDLRMSTNYLETLRMLASVGLGWTVLPDFMAGDALRCLSVRGTRLTRTLGLVVHRDRSPSRSAQAFIAMLRDTARQTASAGTKQRSEGVRRRDSKSTG
ncbi:MAG: LysR family transcriptional regulator [Halieaceae bacterium]|jgi:DNA-binding transcriptional LysR family regulator|nr:LysR family transcriptional regulator [Halieaceae bacterium]